MLLLSLVTVSDATESAPETPANQPPAQLAVSPGRFEFELASKPISDTLRVFNLGDEDVVVRVSVVSWDLDAENKIRHLAPTEQSLDQWMIINPLRFTIPAKGAQTVRFAVRPKLKPSAGEHRAMIYLTQEKEADPNVPFTVRFRLGIALYAMVNEYTQLGNFDRLEINTESSSNLSAKLHVSSLGNAHVRLIGDYSIWNKAAYPGKRATQTLSADSDTTNLPDGLVHRYQLPTVPILGGTERWLSLENFPANLAPGEYVLDLNGMLNQIIVDEAHEFRVKPTKP